MIYHVKYIVPYRDFTNRGWYWEEIKHLGLMKINRYTPRSILSLIRKMGYLDDSTKGKVRMELLTLDMIEIVLKSNNKPILVLIPVKGE